MEEKQHQPETEQAPVASENENKDMAENKEQENTASTEESEVTKLTDALNEMKDKYMRLMAEFDNFRKRTAKERAELISTASKSLMLPLLEVMDDIERADAAKEKVTDLEKRMEGNELIFQKFRNILTQKGLSPMQCVGKEFNADEHEAITTVDAGEENSGKVIDELEKGYLLNEQIIRHAKVVVGK